MDKATLTPAVLADLIMAPVARESDASVPLVVVGAPDAEGSPASAPWQIPANFRSAWDPSNRDSPPCERLFYRPAWHGWLAGALAACVAASLTGAVVLLA